ncbi:glycosyltransferase family protein [Rhizobium sp.]|uniref:glycosyltransferase family protein n=1 Tax=Rhizobium sp. TaxID=391 RepID=UPI0028AB3DB9
MTVLAILQARVSSSRLPKKVLAPILGKPMLARQIERLKHSETIDRLVVATSNDPSDDALVGLCADIGISCHRGSLNDVLQRFAGAFEAFGPADTIVRLTGDCPLADPAVIDRVIREHLASGADYTTNAIECTWPDGLDAEVMRGAVLRSAASEAALPSQREHVTPFIYNNPQRFKIAHVKNGENLSHLRWTVDEPADLAFVTEVYTALYPEYPAFGTADILALLARRPELATINGSFERNEGYAKSLQLDTTSQK